MAMLPCDPHARRIAPDLAIARRGRWIGGGHGAGPRPTRGKGLEAAFVGGLGALRRRRSFGLPPPGALSLVLGALPIGPLRRRLVGVLARGSFGSWSELHGRGLVGVGGPGGLRVGRLRPPSLERGLAILSRGGGRPVGCPRTGPSGRSSRLPVPLPLRRLVLALPAGLSGVTGRRSGPLWSVPAPGVPSPAPRPVRVGTRPGPRGPGLRGPWPVVPRGPLRVRDILVPPKGLLVGEAGVAFGAVAGVLSAGRSRVAALGRVRFCFHGSFLPSLARQRGGRRQRSRGRWIRPPAGPPVSCSGSEHRTRRPRRGSCSGFALRCIGRPAGQIRERRHKGPVNEGERNY
jgi:hypothetical protein